MRGNAKDWSGEEVQYLIENYHKLGSKAVAVALGKSENSIRQKASKMRLKGKRLTVAEQHQEAQAKECSRCHEIKPFSEFHKAKKYAYGYTAWCKDCIATYGKKRRENPEVVRRERESHRRARIGVMLHYCPDGILKCACCGETEVKFLSLDHIDGGGNAHRREIGRGPTAIFGWLKRNNYPPGFQVLCHNCNMAKGFYGVCPHQEKV